MFARAISFSLLALPLLAAAVALPGGGDDNPPPALCAANTGSAQCCDSSTQVSAQDDPIALLLGLLGVVVGDVVGLVGLTCDPILGANTCGGTAVCCTNNSFNGVIAAGCTPITVNA